MYTININEIEKKADEIYFDSLPFFNDSESEDKLMLGKELEDLADELISVKRNDDTIINPFFWENSQPESFLPCIVKIHVANDMIFDPSQNYDECYNRWEEYWEEKYNDAECEAELLYIHIKEFVKELRIASGDIIPECNIDDLESWKEILLSIDPEDLEDDGSETGDFEQNKIFSEAYNKVSDAIDKLVYLETVNGHRIDRIWVECFEDMPHMLFKGGIIGIEIEDSIPYCLKYIDALIKNN